MNNDFGRRRSKDRGPTRRETMRRGIYNSMIVYLHLVEVQYKSTGAEAYWSARYNATVVSLYWSTGALANRSIGVPGSVVRAFSESERPEVCTYIQYQVCKIHTVLGVYAETQMAFGVLVPGIILICRLAGLFCRNRESRSRVPNPESQQLSNMYHTIYHHTACTNMA